MVPSDLLVGMYGIISDGQPALMQAGRWVQAQRSRASDRVGLYALERDYSHWRRCVSVAKRFGRPSLQYRYEHYDPFTQ